MRQHDGEWVAVANGKVIAIEADPKRLSEILRAQGIDRAHTLVVQLPPSDRVWVF
ncbi:MAG: DUF5678 domain-containing protein [Dehalococcoidia bacterium]